MNVEEAMKQAEASLKLEGIEIKDSYRQLVRQILTKQISEEEFRGKVIELIHKRNYNEE
ncbi:MAG TPA: hypothetical protein VNR61_07225 [Niallia sp.]|nr:hypothetical protein [Niallia sp.]